MHSRHGSQRLVQACQRRTDQSAWRTAFARRGSRNRWSSNAIHDAVCVLDRDDAVAGIRARLALARRRCRRPYHSSTVTAVTRCSSALRTSAGRSTPVGRGPTRFAATSRPGSRLPDHDPPTKPTPWPTPSPTSISNRGRRVPPGREPAGDPDAEGLVTHPASEETLLQWTAWTSCLPGRSGRSRPTPTSWATPRSRSRSGRDAGIVDGPTPGEHGCRRRRDGRRRTPRRGWRSTTIELGNSALQMQCVMPTGLSCAGRPAPSAGSRVWSACGRHVLGDRTGDIDPLDVRCGSCPGRRSLLRSPLLGVLVATERGRSRGAHVVPLVEGKRRELDRRDVCPGGPTGQHRAADPAVESSTPRASDA